MKKGLFLLLLVLVIFSYAEGTLSVYNAQSLGLNQDQQGVQNIDFSIANFGFVPFGKTMIGQLVVSPNFSDQCQFQGGSQMSGDQSYFMIVPRGNCKFVPKALNAQKAGAKMVIIMDNQTYSEPFIMSDNGQGYKVKIPAIFVNRSDGDNLLKLVQKAKQKSQRLVLKVNFENQKTQKATLKFYLQANNRRSYKLVNDFQQFYEKISPFVDLNLIYHIELCPFCLKEDCYFGQQYCTYGYRKEEGATGRHILDQQIRQMIVFVKQPSKWWGWMSYVGDQCVSVSQLKQCSQKGMKKVGIDVQSIQKQFDGSFDQSGNNKYLFASSEGLMYSGINKYPAVSINGNNIRGTISAQYLFDDVCNTLTNPPEQCQKYVHNQTVVVTYVKQYWLLLFFIIIAGFVIFSGLFILYKRYMKRRMSADMKNRVDDMVSKYIEFYSERAGRN